MAKVRLEVNEHIGIVTINRPERLNSFDYETLVELEEMVEDLALNDEVRVVVVTGAGDKAFSAGADLKERRTLNEREVRRNVRKIRDVFTAIEELPQPTIAAINGYAFGGGFELALVCDFRYASAYAQLGLTEVSQGIIPGAGGTQRLQRLAGVSFAKELIYTARRIDAEEANKKGILSKVVPHDQLLDNVQALASEITKNAPLAVKQAKYAIQQGMDVDRYSGLAIESKAYELIIPTEDRLEALSAFSEKRQPNFKGK